MSIPPLVCSTPPPPDQCEDDKDPEDFDLSYNLSQEDEDESNDYNYGNFSSYNNFQSTIDNKQLELKNQELTQTKDEIHKELLIEYGSKNDAEHRIVDEGNLKISDINENKLKGEEDVNIEDLDLKVNEDIVIASEDVCDQNNAHSTGEDINSYSNINIPHDSILDENKMKVFNDYSNPLSLEEQHSVENKEENLNEPFENESNLHTNKDDTPSLQETDDQLLNDPHESSIQEGISQIDDTKASSHANVTTELENCEKECNEQSHQIVTDDDFGDFDDFQTINIVNNATSPLDTCENPWENSNTNDCDFGDFTANFDDNKFENVMHSENHGSNQQLERLENNDKMRISNDVEGDDDDDDFGDFDDFKPSAAVKCDSNEISEEETSQHLSVLNLQTIENEYQIMENITKVINSIFEEEISQPEDDFEGKLETLLSETWGHLMEIDERQPYIVNWNNSLGQKTLLRALCIDSRNILFGPKWSSHMPKYAANLSNAPLQPQKQSSTPSNTSQSETLDEQSSSKAATWTDPFTSDGRDSCNTENDAPVVAPGPTDLDVFEAAIANKPEKIYSNTIGVQPLRQINLPDTHIFTPTDSEIPRSKTIHYDSGNNVLLTQTSIADPKNQENSLPQNNVQSNNLEDDTEYWEFQDFKGASVSSSIPGTLSQPQMTSQDKFLENSIVVDALPQPSIAYQTQLLQPIKVEPAVPTLNWPDPGEVKGVFDDFSEFVSIPTHSTDNQDNISVTPPKELQIATIKTALPENRNDFNEKYEDIPKEREKSDNVGFDDDFDSFQSAIPTSIATASLEMNSYASRSGQFPLNQIDTLSYTSSLSNSSNKSDVISFPISKPTEALTQSIGLSNTIELTNKNSLSSGSHLQTNVLQPTPAGSSSTNIQSQQKSGQILQPLSLESYSQINWPSPGFDLQDLSRFNPVETLNSLKSELSVSGLSKTASPVHNLKSIAPTQNIDDDWGDFVSSKPKPQQALSKKQAVIVDDDEWTDFISSPSIKPQNGLNTISLNVHTNSNMQKTAQGKLTSKGNQPSLDIPTLNYITPKSSAHKSYNEKHFQNL